MIDANLPFSLSTAERLSKIAAHPEIGNSGSNPNLPASWTVLSKLTSLSADAKRNRLTDTYSAVRDAAKARMLAGKPDPGELVPQGADIPAPRTRDICASGI